MITALEEMNQAIKNAREKMKARVIEYKKSVEDSRFKQIQDKHEFEHDLKDFHNFYTQYPGAKRILDGLERGIYNDIKESMAEGNNRKSEMKRIKLMVFLEIVEGLKDENNRLDKMFGQFFDNGAE